MNKLNQNDVKTGIDKMSDSVTDTINKAKDQTKEYSQQFEKQVKESPWKSSLVIIAVGFLLGKLL